MISGVPSFVRQSGDSGPEIVAAVAAQASIFAGQVTWSLTLLELFERCVFTASRNVGFFVIDGIRGAISHHGDAVGAREAEMFSVIQFGAEAESNGYSRFTVEALEASPSSAMQFRRQDGTALLSSITPPSGVSLAPFELALLNSLNPVFQRKTAGQIIGIVDELMMQGTTHHWVCLASQRTGILTFWAVNLGSSSLLDFTAAEIGITALDAAFGFRASLTD